MDLLFLSFIYCIYAYLNMSNNVHHLKWYLINTNICNFLVRWSHYKLITGPLRTEAATLNKVCKAPGSTWHLVNSPWHWVLAGHEIENTGISLSIQLFEASIQWVFLLLQTVLLLVCCPRKWNSLTFSYPQLCQKNVDLTENNLLLSKIHTVPRNIKHIALNTSHEITAEQRCVNTQLTAVASH